MALTTTIRGPQRRGWRNGYKPRMLKTRVGELELMVPKDPNDEKLYERKPSYLGISKSL